MRPDPGRCDVTPVVGRAALAIVRSATVPKYATTARQTARQCRPNGPAATLSVETRRDDASRAAEREPPLFLGDVRGAADQGHRRLLVVSFDGLKHRLPAGLGDESGDPTVLQPAEKVFTEEKGSPR